MPPFIPPTRVDGKIHGRGSCDAKSMMACMCTVANKISLEHPDVAEQIALLFVVGEEAGHAGMTVATNMCCNTGNELRKRTNSA